MGDIRQNIQDRVADFRVWRSGRLLLSARLVHYCGDECTGGVDLALEEAEGQIRSCLEEGFRADWDQNGQRLCICISESVEGPLDWQKVLQEQHLSDTGALLRRAGFEPGQENEKAP